MTDINETVKKAKHILRTPALHWSDKEKVLAFKYLAILIDAERITEAKCIEIIEREKFADDGYLSDHDKLANHRLDEAIKNINNVQGIIQLKTIEA